MVKGVTRRIVEIKRPGSDYFERAVLYLRSDRPFPRKREAIEQAKDYLNTLEPSSSHAGSKRDLRPVVAVLTLSLCVTVAALLVLLVLFTKI